MRGNMIIHQFHKDKKKRKSYLEGHGRKKHQWPKSKKKFHKDHTKDPTISHPSTFQLLKFHTHLYPMKITLKIEHLSNDMNMNLIQITNKVCQRIEIFQKKVISSKE